MRIVFKAIRYRLASLLGVLLLASCVMVIGTRVWRTAAHADMEFRCRSNLRILSMLLTSYVERHGGNIDWPTATPLPGIQAPVGSGPNWAFWSHLSVGTNSGGIAPKPGCERLLHCPVWGLQFRSLSLDYTAPNLTAVWPSGPYAWSDKPAYPGSRLSSAVRNEMVITGDLIGPPDVPNHGGTPGAPTSRWNGLRWDGVVDFIEPSSAGDAAYRITTTGSRYP